MANVRLLYDNTSPRKASIVNDFLKQKVVVLPHPPYSRDFASCVFFLFPKLKKKYISGRQFVQRKFFSSALFQCLHSKPKKDYGNAFKDLIGRLNFVHLVEVNTLKEQNINFSENYKYSNLRFLDAFIFEHSSQTICSNLSLYIFQHKHHVIFFHNS